MTHQNQQSLKSRLKNLYHLFDAMWWAWRYDFPGKKLKVVGVTGTDGKTSTTYMAYHLLKTAGAKVALINTVQAIVGEEVVETGAHVTTQSPRDLQPLLRKILAKGFDTVILEVTSHGLQQHRVWGIDFDVAVITNVKEDHLDYHGTAQNYLRAKAKLFQSLHKGRNKGLAKTAILNAADASFSLLSQQPCTSKIIYNSDFCQNSSQTTLLTAKLEKQDINGMSFKLSIDSSQFNGFLPLLGDYNLENAQAAASVGLAFGLKGEAMAKAFTNLPQIPGRMQKIDAGQPYTAIVDFAHTPAALEHALKALRALHPKRLIVLFGCAGARDKGRHRMGEIAAKLADIAIITNEDNRKEPITSILQDIARYASEAGSVQISNGDKGPGPGSSGFICIADRRAAIKYAIQIAQPGDILDFTGKGHEPTLNVDGIETPWNEATEVTKAIQNQS